MRLETPSTEERLPKKDKKQKSKEGTQKSKQIAESYPSKAALKQLIADNYLNGIVFAWII